MNYWLLIKQLAAAGWLFFAAAIFAVVASRFQIEAGLSAAFVVAVALSAIHALWLLVFCWNTWFRKLLGLRPPADRSRGVISSVTVRRAAFAAASLLSFSLVLLAVSYIVTVLHLQGSIDRFPNQPGELVRDYIDELANVEGAMLGTKGAAEIYHVYAYRYHKVPPEMITDEDQVYWGLKKAHYYGRQTPGEDPRALATEVILMADIDFGRGNLDAATALYKEAASEIEAGEKLFSQNDETSTNKGRAFIGLGKISAARRQFDESAKYFEKARQAAEHSVDWNTDDQIAAILGLAEAKKQLGDMVEAEALANEATVRAEKSYLWHRNEQWQVPKAVAQLIPALVKKAEILRMRGKAKEARATDMRIDEVQQNMRPHIKLDDRTQSLMIDEVKGITGCLLEVKYRMPGAQAARNKLSEKLSRSGLDSLNRLTWYKSPGQPAPARTAPHMVSPDFDQISIKSPDEYGFIRVFARGHCQTKSSMQPDASEPFMFVYLMKPPGESGPSPQIQEVEELDSGAFPKERD